MKSTEWMRFFVDQHRRLGKVVFAVTELANSSGMARRSLLVHLNRMTKAGVIRRYAHGLYGSEPLRPEEFLPYLDRAAYCTGHYALFKHGIVTQAPALVTCFANRRHGRRRVLRTGAGDFEFVMPSARIYRAPAAGVLAPAHQALCDFVFLCLRKGVSPDAVVSLRRLHTLDGSEIDGMLAVYPLTVRREVRRMMGG
jgi:hypothetical protein